MLRFTEKGIYCPQADVYLDPWKPVERAIITHGHSDHARWGSKHYLCTHEARPVIEYRLRAADQSQASASVQVKTDSPDELISTGGWRAQSYVESVEYGQTVTINGVHFSFHPAGHIIGSAQIRVESDGEVWAFTGDYKLEDDGVCQPFEPIRCHSFITESTFGLPVYTWRPQAEIFSDINDWWRKNQAEGKTSVLSAYSLGKAQRILRNLDVSVGKIAVHGAIDNVNQILNQQGVNLPATIRITPDMTRKEWEGALVLCPPSAVGSSWMRKFLPYSLGVASGWMSLRGTRRRRGADRGFALSDHADWKGLNQAIQETGAEKVFVTHGYTSIFSQWLRSIGKDAHEVRTEFEGEISEEKESTAG